MSSRKRFLKFKLKTKQVAAIMKFTYTEKQSFAHSVLHGHAVGGGDRDLLNAVKAYDALVKAVEIQARELQIEYSKAEHRFAIKKIEYAEQARIEKERNNAQSAK